MPPGDDRWIKSNTVRLGLAFSRDPPHQRIPPTAVLVLVLSTTTLVARESLAHPPTHLAAGERCMSRLLFWAVLVCQLSELSAKTTYAQASSSPARAEERSADSKQPEPRNQFDPPPEPPLFVGLSFDKGFRGRLEGFDGDYVNFRDLDSSKSSRVHLYDMTASTLKKVLVIAEREQMVPPPSFRVLDDFWNYLIDGQVVIGRHYETKKTGEVGIVVFSTIRNGQIFEKKPLEVTWYKVSDFTDPEDRSQLESASSRNSKISGMFVKPKQLVVRPPETEPVKPPPKKVPDSDSVFECMSCHRKFNGQKKKCPDCGVVFGFIQDEFGNKTRLDTGPSWGAILSFAVLTLASISTWIMNKVKA